MDQEKGKQLNMEQIVIATDVDDFMLENEFEEMSKSEVDTLTIRERLQKLLCLSSL